MEKLSDKLNFFWHLSTCNLLSTFQYSQPWVCDDVEITISFNVTLDPNDHVRLGDRDVSVGVVFELVWHRANISNIPSTDMVFKTKPEKVTFSFYKPGIVLRSQFNLFLITFCSFMHVIEI